MINLILCFFCSNDFYISILVDLNASKPGQFEDADDDDDEVFLDANKGRGEPSKKARNPGVIGNVDNLERYTNV